MEQVRFMKKIHILTALLFALPLITLTSCLKDESDVFDKSASTRLQEQLDKTREVLRGATNGWVVDYYHGTDQAYGGKAFVVKFDSLECTVMSELTGDQSATSYYKLTSDNGPVLTFDTYNEVLHKLSTPSSSAYEGQLADFEMTVMSVTPEKVVLKGKKTNDYMYMYPLQGSASEYLQKVAAMSDSVIVASAFCNLSNDSVFCDFDVDNRIITITSRALPDSTLNVAYTYTDTGLRLYKDVTINGAKLSSLVYNGETSTLTVPDTDVKFYCNKPEGWLPFEDFAGSYVLFCNDGTNQLSLPVSLVPQEDGSTYSLTGLSTAYDVKLSYKKAKGALLLAPQLIETVGSYDVKICMLDTDGSYLTQSTDAGLYMMGSVSDPNVFTFQSNGYEDFISGSIIVWLFQGGDFASGSEVRSWLSSHTQYSLAGNQYLPRMINMTRVE